MATSPIGGAWCTPACTVASGSTVRGHGEHLAPVVAVARAVLAQRRVLVPEPRLAQAVSPCRPAAARTAADVHCIWRQPQPLPVRAGPLDERPAQKCTANT